MTTGWLLMMMMMMMATELGSDFVLFYSFAAVLELILRIFSSVQNSKKVTCRLR